MGHIDEIHNHFGWLSIQMMYEYYMFSHLISSHRFVNRHLTNSLKLSTMLKYMIMANNHSACEINRQFPVFKS